MSDSGIFFDSANLEEFEKWFNNIYKKLKNTS